MFLYDSPLRAFKTRKKFNFKEKMSQSWKICHFNLPYLNFFKAKSLGSFPSISLAWMFRSYFKSTLATLSCPFIAALCRAVLPSIDVMDGSLPCCSNNSATLSLPKMCEYFPVHSIENNFVHKFPCSFCN